MKDTTAQETVTAQDHAIDLARWYHELAKLCVEAAQATVQLTEESKQQELDAALALGDQVRIRMASVQSASRVFRTEFERLYINHHVAHILSLDPGPDRKAAGAAAGKL